MSDKMLRIYNRAVAVVTGAASGIGRGLAKELAKRGSDVIVADIQIELAEEVASAIRTAGGKAQAVKLDVTDISAVGSLLQNTMERTGRLDYLFNNAGICIAGPIGMHTPEDWNRIIGVNLRGVINGVHCAYPIMLHQGFGHIVNTASVAGLMPSPGIVAYSTTKHAVVGLSMSLRAEIAQSGIRVSVLCPGVVRTPILTGGKYGKLHINLSDEQLQKALEQLKPMSPDQFARKALDAIARNCAVIIIPSWFKLFWWINRLTPALLMLFIQKQFEKLLKRWPWGSSQPPQARSI
ncbi:MAG: SDR family oxidoreductase [Kiritimatiellae bacterium]|nr:SDR family oxidoreductase [Kiritimatiellia bacterium]